MWCSHSDWGEMKPHCLWFLWYLFLENLRIYFDFIFCKMPVTCPLPIFNWIFCFVVEFLEFWCALIISLVYRVVCEHFLPFCWLLLYSIDDFLCSSETSLLDVIPFIFALIAYASGVFSKKSAYAKDWQIVALFSSSNLVISGHGFRSLIHLELIFVISVRKGLVSYFYTQRSNFCSTICWRDCSFSLGSFQFVCQKLVGHRWS